MSHKQNRNFYISNDSISDYLSLVWSSLDLQALHHPHCYHYPTSFCFSVLWRSILFIWSLSRWGLFTRFEDTMSISLEPRIQKRIRVPERFVSVSATSMHFSLYRLPFGTYIHLPTSNIQSRMARTYKSGSSIGWIETACHYNMSKSIQCFNCSTTT